MTVSVASPYSRRQAPSDPSALKGFLDQENQNIQRAIDASYPGAIIVRKTGDDDDTQRIQGAIKSGRTTFLTDGDFTITDDLLPASNSQIVLAGPATTITQTTAGKGVFKRIRLDNSWIHYNGGTIYGPGIWSAAWAGIDGHNERGEQVYGCTNSGSTWARIKNFGLAGLVALGGDATFLCPDVEGTHVLGTPLTPGASYQFGYLIGHDLTYGAFTKIRLICPTGYYVNFGFNSFMNIPGSTGLLSMPSAHFYNVIGQHGGYCGTSNTHMPDYTAHDCGLDGLKIFSGAINEVITGSDVSNFNIYNCPNGQAVEIGVSGSGYIYKCHASGKAENCARAITYDGDVRRTNCEIEAENLTQRALYVSNSLNPQGPRDCKWELTADTTFDRGVLINSPTSDRNTLLWKGSRNSTGPGIDAMVDVFAGTVAIDRLDCFDDGGTMPIGLNVGVGATAHLNCSPSIKGYTTNGVKSLGTLYWSAPGQDFTSDVTAFASAGDGIIPLSPLRLSVQSVSATDVVLWQQTLTDPSACTIEATLVGKKSGSVDQGTFTSIVMAMRNGAGAVIPAVVGNPTTLASIPSPGFLGTYSWNVSGNILRLLVNSGAAATVVDWSATIKQVRQT